jgi:EmrB/QacA subfamily drug resistance transporter
MPVIQKKERLILILATLASFFVPYLTSSITVALPVIGREFSLDAVFLGWVMSSYILSTALCIVPLGRIADIYGRKRLFIIGIAFLTVGSLLSTFAWSAGALIAFRIIQGAGGAMIFTTSVAILTSVFPSELRGWALGITLASVYGGLSLGPFIGGLLTAFLGWRSIFLVVVLPGLAVLWITARYVGEEWIDAQGARFDITGSVFYAISLFGLMYGMTLVPDPLSVVWILLGIMILPVFLWWESRSPSPVLDLQVFRNNVTFTFSNLAALINYASTYAVAFLLSLYLQYSRGLSPEAAGFILVAQPVVQSVLSPSAGRMSDRIEPRVVASVGMIFTAAGLLFFVFLSENMPLIHIFLILIMMGFGYALFSSPNTNAIMSSVASSYYGVASSMVATMRALGQLGSMAIAMMIFSLVMGRVEVTPEVYPLLLSSVRWVFGVMFVLSVLGVFASLARGSMR